MVPEGVSFKLVPRVSLLPLCPFLQTFPNATRLSCRLIFSKLSSQQLIKPYVKTVAYGSPLVAAAVVVAAAAAAVVAAVDVVVAAVDVVVAAVDVVVAAVDVVVVVVVVVT